MTTGALAFVVDDAAGGLVHSRLDLRAEGGPEEFLNTGQTL